VIKVVSYDELYQLFIVFNIGIVFHHRRGNHQL